MTNECHTSPWEKRCSLHHAVVLVSQISKLKALMGVASVPWDDGAVWIWSLALGSSSSGLSESLIRKIEWTR